MRGVELRIVVVRRLVAMCDTIRILNKEFLLRCIMIVGAI